MMEAIVRREKRGNERAGGASTRNEGGRETRGVSPHRRQSKVARQRRDGKWDRKKVTL